LALERLSRASSLAPSSGPFRGCEMSVARFLADMFVLKSTSP